MATIQIEFLTLAQLGGADQWLSTLSTRGGWS